MQRQERQLDGSEIAQTLNSVAVRRRGKLGDFSESPKSMLDLVPDVCSGEERESANVVESGDGADAIVPGGQAPSPELIR